MNRYPFFFYLICMLLSVSSRCSDYQSVYDVSASFFYELKRELGSRISGLLYIKVDGRNFVLDLDKQLAEPVAHVSGESSGSAIPQLILPEYIRPINRSNKLGGAYDDMSDEDGAGGTRKHKFSMDFDGVDARKNNDNQGRFLIFLKKVCLDPDVKESTRNNYMFTYRKMLEFAYRADFSDINYSFIQKFHSWLARSCKCNQNTVAKHSKVLRKAVNQAIKLGYMNATDNPFFNFPLRLQTSYKEVLSLQELAKIDCYFHKNFDSLQPTYREVLGAFLFGCYTGLRFSDLSAIKRNNITKKGSKHWLTVATKKTSQIVRIPLDDIFSGRSVLILNRFGRKAGNLFKLPSNANSNRIIKLVFSRIHKRIKPDKVSFHTARRTMATQLLAMQVPITSVQTLLGHASVRTTEVYAKVKDQTLCNDIRHAKKDKFNSAFKAAAKRITKRE